MKAIHVQTVHLAASLVDILLELCGFFVVLLLLRVFIDRLPGATEGQRRLRQGVFGLFVGLGTMLSMSMPFHLADGVIADARMALIAAATVFCGPVVGGVSFAVSSLFRLWLGGAGQWAGIAGNLGALLTGLLFYHLSLGRGLPVRGKHLIGAAISVSLALGAAALLLPHPQNFDLLMQFGPAVMAVNGLGVLVLGSLLLLDDRRRAAHERLAVAEAEARARAEAKTRFLALMSHEVRTPMTAILGMTRLLSEEPLQARQLDYVRAMRAAGENMMLLLNDILDVTRLEAGRLELDRRPFNLMELLSDLRTLYQPQIQAKGLNLRVEFPPRETLWLQGDAIRIRQIISNLLNNALKFTTSGTITFGCDLLALDRQRADLSFSVRDTGHGIAPEKLDTLFSPFVAGERGPSARQGAGIGLAISGDLTRMMGGDIKASSIIGVGSEFTLRLALDLADPVRVPNAEPVGGGSGLRILLAEDVPANQMLIREVLTRSGHLVDVVGDGRAAVEAVRRNGPYDLVLMDSHMPEMDGISAIRALKTFEAPPPVIALTADVSTQARQDLEAAGVYSILPKPVPWADLLAVIAGFAPRRGERSQPSRPYSLLQRS